MGGMLRRSVDPTGSLAGKRGGVLAPAFSLRFTPAHGCGGKPARWDTRPTAIKPHVSDSLSQFGYELRGILDRWDSGASGDPMDEAWFRERAVRLFQLQFDSNVAYRTQCEGSGIRAELIDDWRAIPAVPAIAFKELTLTSLPPGLRTAVFHSSGTSGQESSRHYHGAESLALYEASLWPWFRTHLVPADSLSSAPLRLGLAPIFLTPPPSAARNSSLVHMLDCVGRHLRSGVPAFFGSVDGDGAWHVSPAPLMAVLDESIREGGPVLLAGTAFNFVHLLDHLAGAGVRFNLPPGSRIMETGGYKGRSRALSRSQLHAGLTDLLGIPDDWIVSEYGMSELGSQAYDAVAGGSCGRRFRFPPWARGTVVSVETGRVVADNGTGLLRIVDLTNVWSVAAIQTEDLAVRRGDGFELLDRAPAALPRGCSLQSSIGN